ncbi:hypothetical protein [Sphingomicrobium nitratireducens]|uniref:hypothetical protein n=1 Tax=Sphingomicrobium nitratireducens TaxID=2964666 RepID=UPI00224081F4|nr:hypothetical protein [Sphingomicrobium nitratireducens]
MRALLLLPILLVAACSTPAVDPPPLHGRAGESLDPRLPVAVTQLPREADPTLLSRLEALVAQAAAGSNAFDALAGQVVPIVEAADAPGSEAWTAAQQALSRLDAARAPVATALADIDRLATGSIEEREWVAPADREAIATASAAVARIDERQSALIDRLTGHLSP